MAPLTELRAVSLRENRKVNDLSPLAGATNMEWLGLLFLENVRDAKPLAGMTRLKRLEWTYCARLEDLSPMESLQELVYLNLGTCAATNAAPIRNLKKLRYATFGYSKMTKAERKAVQDALPECEVR
jgi:Leucine-rich repeat (LRR) protein